MGQPWVRDFEVRTEKGHGWLNLTMAGFPEIVEIMETYQAKVRAEARQRPGYSFEIGVKEV
jgi:hypothetical protein